jgi:hypothetical protein
MASRAKSKIPPLATLALRCGCLRSMIVPVAASIQPHKLSGSSSRWGAPAPSLGTSLTASKRSAFGEARLLLRGVTGLQLQQRSGIRAAARQGIGGGKVDIGQPCGLRGDRLSAPINRLIPLREMRMQDANLEFRLGRASFSIRFGRRFGTLLQRLAMAIYDALETRADVRAYRPSPASQVNRERNS